jgi:ABC-type glycerol-3-phosphate transport system substrate-binding protein
MTPFDVYTGDSFVIPAHAKHQQLAAEFLSYLMQPDVINTYAAENGSIPPYSDTISASVLKRYSPLVQEMLQLRQQFGLVGIWDSDVPGEIGQKTEVPLLQAMLSGQANVQQTAQKFQDALDHVRSEPPTPLD